MVVLIRNGKGVKLNSIKEKIHLNIQKMKKIIYTPPVTLT